MAETTMLPEDMLADVLVRLPPRSLATSRCVCTAWRAVIDGRGLLRADLLPLSLAGLFVNYQSELSWSCVELFSRPSPKNLVGSSFQYPPHVLVDDHCNGLLLLRLDYRVSVLNPATGWRMALPECPQPAHAGTEYFRQDMYLVFDPTVSSSDFEVFLVPRVPFQFSGYGARQIDTALLGSRWPLSPCILNVFSSVAGRWEERSFHRDGGDQGAGTVADMQKDAGKHLFMRRRKAVCFRGALYVHCECDFVMRISLSTNKYSMIKPPPTAIFKFTEFHLGKSENGVYFALLGDGAQLWVWILAETNGQAEWILRHGTGAGLLLPSLDCIETFHHAPWILRNVTQAAVEADQDALDYSDDDQQAAVEDDQQLVSALEHNGYGWNSDNDEEETILHNKNNGQTECSSYLEILAFHPYKEILFLHSRESKTRRTCGDRREQST